MNYIKRHPGCPLLRYVTVRDSGIIIDLKGLRDEGISRDGDSLKNVLEKYIERLN